MRPDSGDLAYLWDMRDAALEAVQFVHGSTYDSFLTDMKLRRAVERDLEIIGEAANRSVLSSGRRTRTSLGLASLGSGMCSRMNTGISSSIVSGGWRRTGSRSSLTY